jgi:DNA-binding response OmpR family regulator/chromosome segregation ATPase
MRFYAPHAKYSCLGQKRFKIDTLASPERPPSMPTKVLVFESDAAFAGELRTELARLGMVAQVVDDGYAGLMAAASERPDLILLSIELPRMNGFSVCNKLKKDPSLKDVPLIIMSTDSSEETFDQHRKLRTRAEDYVRKPIAFGELLEHMRPFVKVENGRPSAGSDDDAIIIDDEIELDGVEGLSAADITADETTQVATAANVEAEVEAFANTAFDRLMDSEPPTSTRSSRAPKEEPSAELEQIGTAERIPSVIPALPRKISSAPPRPQVDADVERLRGETERQKAELARMERELQTARAEVTRLEDAARQSSESDERVTKLQRELDELKLKPASGGKVAGVSSREFLDLREGLNKKEKEILSLRDQVTRKEKELLDTSDTTLALERDKADLEDKITGLERDLASAKTFADTAKADKDQASKRADDFKTRGEKVKVELDAKLAELATIGKKQEAELAERDANLAAHREQAQRDADAAAEASRAALEAAEKAADQKLQASLEEALEMQQREREGALAKLAEETQADKAGALAAQQKDYDARIAALVEGYDARIATLVQDSETRIGTLVHDYDARIAALVQSHEEDQNRLKERVAELSTELSARIEEREELARELPKTKEKLTTAETQLASTRAELSEIRDKLNLHSQRLDTANTKWDQNRKTLDQAKDALAAALAQIEEAESRGLD